MAVDRVLLCVEKKSSFSVIDHQYYQAGDLIVRSTDRSIEHRYFNCGSDDQRGASVQNDTAMRAYDAVVNGDAVIERRFETFPSGV